MASTRGALRPDAQQWVRDLLISWGKWVELQHRAGYGNSSLTIDPNNAPVRAYVPVNDLECLRTDEAVMKQSRQLQDLAAADYVHNWDVVTASRQLRVSERQYRRLREMLHNGVEFCLRNEGVAFIPAHILLKK